jgi:Hemerythrin HHE cation binding domain
MSIIDKVVAAVTPPESDDARREARDKARASTSRGDWLSMILDHHEQIEAAFAAVRSATTPSARIVAHKELATLLTGHSNAEEAVIYPALAGADEKRHAMSAYGEQATAKVEMGLLENIPPMSKDFLDKLEHIRGAVAHHIYEEESKWFLELKQNVPSADQLKLSKRYEEEFTRYVGVDLESLSEGETAMV